MHINVGAGVQYEARAPSRLQLDIVGGGEAVWAAHPAVRLHVRDKRHLLLMRKVENYFAVNERFFEEVGFQIELPV